MASHPRHSLKPKVGRPSVMTLEIISKLEEVFAMGGSDAEACSYANISSQPMYEYQKTHPEFIERKNMLRERPILKARSTVVKALGEPEHAKWYLEKKRRKEFGPNGEEGGKIVVDIQFITHDQGRYQTTVSTPEAGRNLEAPIEV